MKENLDKSGGQHDELELLLDRALTSYTPDSGRSGLEERILARIAGDAEVRRSRFSFSRSRLPLRYRAWAAVALVATAAALVAVLIRPHVPGTSTNLAGIQGHQPSASSLKPGEQAPIAAPQEPRRRMIHRTPSTRSTQHFVQPRPTQQELLIAQLLVNAPDAVASLARAQAESGLDKPLTFKPIAADPLVIEPIKIAPINDEPAVSGGAF